MSIATTPQFGNSSISVTIEWTPEDSVIYRAVVVPETAPTFLKRSKILVIPFYNIQYNITIAATTCGQNSERITTAVSLSYGECRLVLILDKHMH